MPDKRSHKFCGGTWALIKTIHSKVDGSFRRVFSNSLQNGWEKKKIELVRPAISRIEKLLRSLNKINDGGVLTYAENVSKAVEYLLYTHFSG